MGLWARILFMNYEIGDMRIYSFMTSILTHLFLILIQKSVTFVFHLAGVNRPKDEKEFMQGNFGFTSTLLDSLKLHKNTCPILITSSTQAERDNPYGKSKKAGEDLLFEYAKQTDSTVYVFSSS